MSKRCSLINPGKSRVKNRDSDSVARVPFGMHPVDANQLILIIIGIVCHSKFPCVQLGVFAVRLERRRSINFILDSCIGLRQKVSCNQLDFLHKR